jgi:hypothetical protein
MRQSRDQPRAIPDLNIVAIDQGLRLIKGIIIGSGFDDVGFDDVVFLVKDIRTKH